MQERTVTTGNNSVAQRAIWDRALGSRGVDQSQVCRKMRSSAGRSAGYQERCSTTCVRATAPENVIPD
jgi:hypothetical protein